MRGEHDRRTATQISLGSRAQLLADLEDPAAPREEFALKLAALKALDGTEITEATILLASPAASTMRTKVLSALDEMDDVLVAA